MIPVQTYSIVARDPTTGELGVAVQSHYFSVGSVVPWAEPGVGVVATQSFLNLAYGPEGLELMRSGRSAPEALADLVARDPEQDLRQVAMVDAAGTRTCPQTRWRPTLPSMQTSDLTGYPVGAAAPAASAAEAPLGTP